MFYSLADFPPSILVFVWDPQEQEELIGGPVQAIPVNLLHEEDPPRMGAPFVQQKVSGLPVKGNPTLKPLANDDDSDDDLALAKELLETVDSPTKPGAHKGTSISSLAPSSNFGGGGNVGGAGASELGGDGSDVAGSR